MLPIVSLFEFDFPSFHFIIVFNFLFIYVLIILRIWLKFVGKVRPFFNFILKNSVFRSTWKLDLFLYLGETFYFVTIHILTIYFIIQ